MTPARVRMSMALMTSTVLISALLLFGMEPLVGRLVVPYYGGAVQVWLTCLTFFQAVLFLGYAYAHLIAKRLGLWHLLVITVPIIVLPLGVTSAVAPDWPTLHLVLTLLRSVALPFAALSTTAVVLQSWLAHSTVGETREPYPLYAASNVGSLLALLAYPFLIEPWVGLQLQSWIWSAAFVVYIGLVAATWFVVQPNFKAPVRAPTTAQLPDNPPTVSDYAYWICLSAVPSAFLLATTNLVASEIGSLPMVWVIPLALYLATFILAFRSGGGAPRWLGALWPELLAAGGVLYFLGMGMAWTGIALIAMLPAVSLIAHGKLYEMRPHPKRLTTFYLVMSLGGWIGGSLITFGAPYVFDGLYEYPLLLVVFAVMFAMLMGRKSLTWFKSAPIYLGGPRLAVLLVLLSLILFASVVMSPLSDLDRHRNFYGTYRVDDKPLSDETPDEHRRLLLHGITIHGSEVQTAARKGIPLEYYHESQCIAQSIDPSKSPKKIAIVGLGSGAMASYTRPGDTLDYYEIDPDNERIARTWFSFLDNAQGSVNVIVGDGRLELERAATKYDLLQIDAFSGDGIPGHLLTSEAMDTWLAHLKDDGVLLFHVSNRYYQLQPVLKSHVMARGLSGAWNPTFRGELPQFAVDARCVVMARNPATLDRLQALGWQRYTERDAWHALTPWTDDHINMLAPLWLAATKAGPANK